MDIILFGFYRPDVNLRTIHICVNKSNRFHPELLCNTMGVTDEVFRRSVEDKRFLNLSKELDISIKKVITHQNPQNLLIELFTHNRPAPKTQFKGTAYRVCEKCLNSLFKLEIPFEETEMSRIDSEKSKFTLKETNRVANVGFNAYVAVSLPTEECSLVLDSNNKAHQPSVNNVLADLDEEIMINFNNETFYAIDPTLEELFEELAGNFYCHKDDPKGQIIRDIKCGKLVIVKLHTISLDIKRKEKVVRSFKIKETKE
jgi:hypothetical protein